MHIKMNWLRLGALCLCSALLLIGCGPSVGGGGTGRLVPQVVLVTPNGGDNWTVGTTYEIDWTVKYISLNSLDIHLSRDGGATWEMIADDVYGGSGGYDWTVTGPVSNSCLFRLEPNDDRFLSDESESAFSVRGTAPLLALTSPVGGEILPEGTSHTVSWNLLGPSTEPVSIEVQRELGGEWEQIATGIQAGDRQFAWSINDIWSTETLLQIVPDSLNYRAEISSNFVIESSDPTYEIVSPNGGEILIKGEQSLVTWTGTGFRGDYVNLHLSRDGGQTWDNFASNVLASDRQISWTVSGPNTSQARFRIALRDQGESFSISDADFRIADPGPELTAVRYQDENFDATLNAGDKLVLTFDSDVVLNAASPSDFSLPVAGDSLGTGATVQLGLTSNEVDITLGTGVRLIVRGQFDQSSVVSGSPSGIAISASMSTDAIESQEGVDVLPGPGVDISPGLVEGSTQSPDMGSRPEFGDYNRDGWVDYRFGYQMVLSDGAGGFVEKSMGRNCHVSGDFDLDGDLDVVALRSAAAGGGIFFENDGSGNFSETSSGFGDSAVVSVCGDVDRDGDLDLVLGRAQRPLIKILLNDGNGAFVDSAQLIDPGDGEVRALVLEDLDLDGDLDLFFGNADGGDPLDLRVIENDGNGTFSDSGQRFSDVRIDDVMVGDIDKDGDLDLICGKASGAAEDLMLNDGNGLFTLSGDVVSFGTSKVGLYDIDDDGSLDAVAYSNNWDPLIYRQAAALQFEHLVSGTESGGPIANFGWADLDRDGDLDMVGDFEGAQSRTYWYNSLSGVRGELSIVSDGNSYASGSPAAIESGDVNADGYDDVLVALTDGSVQVFVSDRVGGFFQFANFSANAAIQAISLNDMDRDGDLDAVLCNDGNEANQIWENDGFGSFSAGGAFDNSNGFDLQVTDLDLDGDLDVISTVGAGTVSQPDLVFLNNGSGGLALPGIAIGNEDSRASGVADLNRDGISDYVEGTIATKDNLVWFGDGDGTFTDSGQSLGTSEVRSIEVFDADRDGDLDLVLGTAGGCEIWVNNGSGVFTDSGSVLGADPVSDIAYADFDEDGDTDIFVTHGNSAAAVLWLNDGDGNFADSGISFELGFTDAEVVDVERDGDVDLVISTAGSGVVVWVND